MPGEYPSYERAADISDRALAFYHGVIRDKAGAVLWRCQHPGCTPHLTPKYARFCAETELQRQAAQRAPVAPRRGE